MQKNVEYVGPIPWLALFGMASGLAGAFLPWARDLPVIKQTLAVGTTIFG